MAGGGRAVQTVRLKASGLLLASSEPPVARSVTERAFRSQNSERSMDINSYSLSSNSVHQLAATRQQILDSEDASQDDRLTAVEAAILAAPISSDGDREAKRKILFQTGEPDFADVFIQKLALSLC